MLAPSPRFVMHYFDRNIIRKKWRRMNRDPMMAASAMVKRIAINSIRNQSKRIKSTHWKSRLNRKPSRPGHPPYSWAPGKPMKMIRDDWTGFAHVSRIIGSVYLGSNPPVPGLHEHGGFAVRTVLVKRPRRLKSGKFGAAALIPTKKTVRYPARPFMYPALIKAKSKYPHLWEGSLNRVA